MKAIWRGCATVQGISLGLFVLEDGTRVVEAEAALEVGAKVKARAKALGVTPDDLVWASEECSDMRAVLEWTEGKGPPS
jgi:hypothetical protein